MYQARNDLLKVLLTGIEETSNKAAAYVSEFGGEPIVCPTQKIQVIAEGVEAPVADWVVFTSANAVKVFFSLYPKVKIKNCAAVGPSTASHLGSNTLIPSEYSAKGLLELLKDKAEGQTILLPCSRKADNTLFDGLREFASEVTRIDTYEPVSCDFELQEFDAVIFFSPSGFEAYLQKAGKASLLNKTVVSIGKKTYNALDFIFPPD